MAKNEEQLSSTVTDVFENETSDFQVSCEFCHKTDTEDVYTPPNAEPECIVLTNEVLTNVYNDHLHVEHNITQYSIFDEKGHMCSIDSGMLERNVKLFITGYVKPIYSDGPGIEDGIAATALGPILEWWITPYYGSAQSLIGIDTEFAVYNFIAPHPNYKKYMKSVNEKINLTKIVIEKMLDNHESDDSTYEDILNCIVTSINPETGSHFTEEDLFNQAQFVLNQVADYDSTGNYDFPLSETQCIKTLIQLSGATIPINALTPRLGRLGRKSTGITRDFEKVTTTMLVNDVFDTKFASSLNVDDKKSENTMSKIVQALYDNLCNVDNNEESSEINFVMWRNRKLCKKMFVVVKTRRKQLIGCIQYFFKTKNMKAHVQIFIHGYETVLEETADSQELFALKKCKNIHISNIVNILDVVHKTPSENWSLLGNSKLQDLVEPVNRDNKQSFFYQLQYDDEFGQFQYPNAENPINDLKQTYCSNCETNKLIKKSKKPVLLEFIENEDNIYYFYKLKLFNEEYKVGNFVYLQPGIFSTASRSNMIGVKPINNNESNENISYQEQNNIDETLYPEFYRKTMEGSMRGSNETTPDPFEIAEILAMYYVVQDKKNIKLIVRRMYRPEQILLKQHARNEDMNLLFWSEEEFMVTYKNIRGKCFVSFNSNIQDIFKWSSSGPDRFYFIKKYDCQTGLTDYQLPSEAKLIGKEVNVDYNFNSVEEDKLQYIPSYKKIEPLRGLDIFAGCGGLSKGLEDSGLIISKWAVESDEKAAEAFKLNNPESTVFVEDCNHILKLAMSGETENSKNQNIPQRGEVDFICGGPPCQGFSGMNRFNSSQYSLSKNSLIVTFLSYIDFYRPRYFVMENVRNFVSFKKNMILKLTLRCITRLGYQCTFGILQAGNFGVPQTRRRLIIMAAAPGEKLPLYPEPIHVFSRKSSSVSIQIGEKKFKTNCRYDESAPMRTVTVYDAWSDLPEIPNGADEEDIMYRLKPITHLQKILRHPDKQHAKSILSDHICKDMSPMVQARMELIPVCEGSDWRDLPNKIVKLSDGNSTCKLVYAHHDNKNGVGPDGALRGVCPCANDKKCNPRDRQFNTIIPWCLPHTGNRHNNWAGLYGRIAWSGYCSTTITNPEPMGKQGRVLHPEQHRVVSVRECARSQGFNDSFKFYGQIIDKHRQIGNAVPPPMGEAIGREILKAIEKNQGL